MAQQGDMWFRIMFDHRQAVAGMKLTSRELQELRVLSADLAGKGLSKLVPQFDKLTRLARADGEQMKVVAASYGQLALQSREALVASRRFAQQLDFEADVLRERAAAGEKLTAAEQQRLAQNERISLAFQEGIDEARSAKARELLDVRRRKNQERQLRKGREFFDRVQQHKTASDKKYLADVKYNSQVMEDIAKREAKARIDANRKYLADVKHNSQVMEEQRKAQLRKGQAFFDRVQQHRSAAIRQETQAQREAFQARQAGQALMQRGMSAQRRNVQQQRELRDALRAGSISAREYAQSIRRLRRELTAMRANRGRGGLLDMLGGGVARGLGAVARNVGLMAVGFRSLQAATASWKMALDIEKTQLQFQIFTGSLGTAQKLMGELRQIAATTSLTLDVSLQSTRTLLQYGVAAQEVTYRLKQLGDIAGGDTERMQRLSLAFGQISAQGRLQGQELRQLVEAGFNPLSEIARTTGRSMLSLRLAMAEGKISIEDVQDALDSATSEGGRFYGQLDKVAKLTTSGSWQVAMGQLKELGATIFSDAAKDTKRGADNIATAAENTKTLIERWREFKRVYGSLRPRYDWLGRYDPTITGVSSGPGMTMDLERGEDRWRRNYAAEAEAEADAYNERGEAIQQSIADRIAALQRENEELREGADAVELRRMREEELAATGRTTHSDELERVQEENARLKEEKKDAERRQREDESALRADQRAADRIMRQYEDPLTTAGREQAEIARLEQQGMITPEVAAQERERITKEYLASQVDEIVEAEKESAAVAGKNSKEEFEMLRRISTQNASSAEKLEQTRHAEQQAELHMINTGISMLPEAISSFIPQAL